MVQVFDDSHYGVDVYEGDNVELLTLTGDSPDVRWIENTLARRFAACACICGCNEAEDDTTTIINGGCVAGFKKRLSILPENQAAEWGEWLDEYRWSEGHYGHTLTYLQDLQRDLWRAENREAIQRTHRKLAARVAETQAKLELLTLKAEHFERIEEGFTS